MKVISVMGIGLYQNQEELLIALKNRPTLIILMFGKTYEKTFFLLTIKIVKIAIQLVKSYNFMIQYRFYVLNRS
jgi:hypothetical protein